MDEPGPQPSARRSFLFLQGPHGPFFDALARALRAAGAECRRAGFNRGDAAFWRDAGTYLPQTEDPTRWPARCAALIAEHAVTDLVVYGDTRFVHASAIARARQAGVTVHVFEEGYLRPYWVTYERGGSNGHSRLMDLTVPQMREALARNDCDHIEAPAHWGDMRQHVWYGALYHAFVLLGNGAYPNFRPHRALDVRAEFRLYLRKLLLMPLLWADRVRATARIRRGGFPYHLALLQLEHDASFRDHSPFASLAQFIDLVIDGFAAGAPRHHHLVFKAHPLEDGRVDLSRAIRARARLCGVADRVHFVRGGKLAQLLDHARSAVTVNSTAGQQALWRGLPLRVFGRAVYAKPEFVSSQPLPEFFARPTRPDAAAYFDFRHYMLETSQLPGGFYSTRGRRQLLRQVADLMLAADDPYDALSRGTAAPRQHLRLIR